MGPERLIGFCQEEQRRRDTPGIGQGRSWVTKGLLPHPACDVAWSRYPGRAVESMSTNCVLGTREKDGTLSRLGGT